MPASAARRRKMYSAIGERQMLPRQTKRIFGFFISPPCSGAMPSEAETLSDGIGRLIVTA
ncbi:TPA: hypothetical protein ACJJ3X_001383 [Neisseria meningitidis]